MKDEINDKPLTQEIIYFLLGKKAANPEQAKLGMEKLGIYPSRKNWFGFIDKMLLVFTVALFISGVFFFFAFNWDAMHKFLKLGLVSGGMLIIALVTFLRRKKELAFQIGLTLLSLLTGAWLATFGQIYQTGANAYDFFLGWTLLILIWVFISRFPPLWILLLVLLNTTGILFSGQVLRIWDSTWLFLGLTLFNFFAMAFWEWMVHYQKESKIGLFFGGKYWLSTRWVPWIIGIASYAMLANVVGYVMYDKTNMSETVAAGLVAVVLYPTGYLVYRNYLKDLLMLAVIALSAIFMGNFLIFRWVSDDLIGATLIGGVLSIGITVLVVKEMVGLSKKWKNNES